MKRMLQTLCMALLMASAATLVSARAYDLSSPDGNIKLTVDVGERISYNVSLEGRLLIADSYLLLETRDNIYGYKARVSSARTTSVDEKIRPVVGFKFSAIDNRYNQLRLRFREGFALELRAYDDGVAYRFVTEGKGEAEVLGEVFDLNFPNGYKVHMQPCRSFITSYEDPYIHMNVWDWKPDDRMATLPALFEAPEGTKILVSESGVLDYPHIFLRGRSADGVSAVFPKAPLKQEDSGDRSMKILLEADYIAKTQAGREFPWRYFVIAEDDGELIENTMTARLAPRSVIEDTSWIEPGQVSW